MRRRIPGAILRPHRHALAQLAVDGVLVALAWYLAFVLRFDDRVPTRYDALLEQTIVPVVLGSLAIFYLFGLYVKQWRYLTRRDYDILVRAVLVATVSIVGLIELLHPVKIPARGVAGRLAVAPPAGVVVLYLLLMAALLGGIRFLRQGIYERPLRGGLRSSGDANTVLIVGAG
ncbi:MAG TPA: polysaccharide biosynthesis protein, partial [Solirubrobacteraceae bacterium]|nr:polysaccharide biosynthesis protein [Solirubrobacteraceae bacterium]